MRSFLGFCFCSQETFNVYFFFIEFSVNVSDCPVDMNTYICRVEDLISRRDGARMEFQELGIKKVMDVQNFTMLHDKLEDLEKQLTENQTCVLQLEQRNFLFWRKTLRNYNFKKLLKLKTKLMWQWDIFLVEGLKQFRDMNRLMELYTTIIDMAIKADDAEQDLNIRQLMEAF